MCFAGQSPGIKGGKAAPVTLVGKAAAPAESKTPTDKGLKPGKVNLRCLTVDVSQVGS